MRLQLFETGQDRPTAITLKAMTRVTGTEVPEILRVTCYRHRFFGTPFYALVQDVLRGPSFWTVGERELFAAYTSKLNQCPFCISAHRAFAGSYVDPATVDAVFESPSTAPIRPEAKAVLTLLDKLSAEPEAVTAADVRAVREAGVDAAALDDAVRTSVLFHVINRVMDAFGAGPLEGRQLVMAPKVIRRLGYRMPPTVRYLSRGV